MWEEQTTLIPLKEQDPDTVLQVPAPSQPVGTVTLSARSKTLGLNPRAEGITDVSRDTTGRVVCVSRVECDH